MKQSVTISRKDDTFTFFENTFNRRLGHRNKEESENLMQSHQKQSRTTNLNEGNNKHNK